MSHQKQATSRPGAMSLLDKYASINASIEDARKRVAATRTQLESTNAAIEKLCEERNGMTEETESAKADASRIQFDLKEAIAERNAKLNAKTRVEREFQMAKREYHETRQRMDAERMDFLEQGREFRASCKRMRVAASILVLDGKFDHGERGIEATENATEVDLWRRLQHEESTFSEDGIDYDDTVVVHNASSVTGRQDGKLAQKKKSKKTDPEMERAEKDEKKSRQALIEAECGLHAMKNEHDDAVMKRNDRNQKLTQQRAQLERHRKEVEEFERELHQTKADILEANQLGKAFEKGKCSLCSTLYLF